MYKLGFIGVGNMGGALLDACAKKIAGVNIIISDFNIERLDYFAQKYGCVPASSEEVAEHAEYIFIGVKPQMAQDAMPEDALAVELLYAQDGMAREIRLEPMGAFKMERVDEIMKMMEDCHEYPDD